PIVHGKRFAAQRKRQISDHPGAHAGTLSFSGSTITFGGCLGQSHAASAANDRITPARAIQRFVSRIPTKASEIASARSSGVIVSSGIRASETGSASRHVVLSVK